MASPAQSAAPPVTGTARVGGRLEDIIARSRQGDIVVLDAPNIDRRSARLLIASGVAAVNHRHSSGDRQVSD